MSTIGHGNALFLADLAMDVSRTQLEANYRQGKYPDLWKGSGHWLRFSRGK